MQLMCLSAPKLQINHLCNSKVDHIANFFSIRLPYFDVTFHLESVVSNISFPRRQKIDYGLGNQVKLVSTSIFAFWTHAISFSVLLVETACKVTHSILYQFVNTWTHWLLIRRNAGVPSLLALYQLHLSLSICSLFFRRSIYFRESILNENKQSIPHPQFLKYYS